MHQPEVLLQQECLLGEGPVWDAAQNCIYWVNILPGDIHRYCLSTGQHSICNVGQMVGAIVLRKEGGLVAAMQHGFYFVDFDNKTVQPITDPEASLPGNRFNDGKCDAAGRFWAGTMPFNEKEPAGSLYMLDKGFPVTAKIKGVTISNGIAWNSDNTVMYYIDTPTRQIVAYDFDLESGSVSNKRVAVDVHHEPGYPDGMTIDSDGMLWVAYYGGWAVVQYNPKTGEALQRITFPVANITCCTFGGESLTDLFVTTARKELSDSELLTQPLAGSVFIIKNIGSKGILPNEFAG
ncbi:MAG TPA: SMP-30/gluconolactonase/LRE family protein [Chitinophagaceae bacterium]|nr:SMP-30/gluconolactonase/LRE family protein [Chitinophagaceae bacterium]